jgi:putative nucleotidyltransferase with HDIG domain
MHRIELLESEVSSVYKQRSPDLPDWVDWVYSGHILATKSAAQHLADKHGANGELSSAAALLHDMAETKVRRSNPTHEQLSLKMARELMQKAGYNSDEINLVVDDAIRFHSCQNGEKPQSLEGKILATADAIAHLTTDFYIFLVWALGSEKTLDEMKEWVLHKIERDYNDKIQFDDVRSDLKDDYRALKQVFSK